MPTEVLNQLRVLRESIADGLRKDPRYLTLTALDKTISEITSLLEASGIDTGGGRPAPLDLNAPAPAPAAPRHETPRESDAGPSQAGLSQAGLSQADRDALAAATMPLVAAALNTTAAQIVASHDEVPRTEAPAPAEVAGEEETTAEAETHALPAAAADAPALEAPHQTARFEPHEPDLPVESSIEPEADPQPAFEAAPELEPAAHAPLPEPEAEPSHHEHHLATVEAAVSAALIEGAPALDIAAEATAPEPLAESLPAEAAPALQAPIERGPDTGYIPMEARPAAAQYQPAMSVKFGKLPNKVDLRPLMPPVTDQGTLHSAVPEAVAGAYQYWIRKASKQERPLSRMFIYYNARWRNGAAQTDEGASIQLTLEGLQKFGAAHADLWPDDARLLALTPTSEAYKDASAFRIHDLAQVPQRIESWKQALAEGKPIIFGCAIFEGFHNCAAHGGVVAYPTAEDVLQGGAVHALCAVGYSESEQVFIVRNCWGTGFGDEGYCYMPFGYLMDRKLNDGDSWVFVPKVPSQPPREMWSDDSRPVTNGGAGVDFTVDGEAPEDYERLPVDLFGAARRPFNGALSGDYSRYLTLAAKGLWDEMEQADVRALLGPASGGTPDTLAEFDRLGASLRSMGIEVAPRGTFALNPGDLAEDSALAGEDDEARWRP